MNISLTRICHFINLQFFFILNIASGFCRDVRDSLYIGSMHVYNSLFSFSDCFIKAKLASYVASTIPFMFQWLWISKIIYDTYTFACV